MTLVVNSYTHTHTHPSVSSLPGEKRGGGGWGMEGRVPVVTIVGTELVMELGGASIPGAWRRGPGGHRITLKTTLE